MNSEVAFPYQQTGPNVENVHLSSIPMDPETYFMQGWCPTVVIIHVSFA